MVSLPELCLLNIFEHFKEDCNTLYSCALVNRGWCSIAIPLLWRNPLEVCHKLDQRKRMMSLVYTYMTCLPEATRQKVGMHVMLQKPPLFDYTRFIRHLIPRLLHFGIEEIVLFCQEYGIFNFTMIRHIYEALCTHILSQANVIETVNLLESGELNIFELPGATKRLSGVKTLICDGDFRKTYIASNACQDLVRLEVRPEEDINVGEEWIIILPEKNMMTIANLIKYQKKLSEIALYQVDQIGFNVCWKYLAYNHVNYLQCIELYKVTFDAEFGFVQQIALFPNLQILKMEDCTGDGSWTYIEPSSFRKLKDLILHGCYFNLQPFEKLFIHAKDSLRNIQFTNPYSTELIQKVIDWSKLYVTNITTIILSIEEQHLESIIALLKNCNNLEYFHIYDMEIQWAVVSLKPMKLLKPLHMTPLTTIDVDYELVELGQILPKTLRVFKVGMDWSFSIESLESFLMNLKAAPKMNILEFSHGYWFADDYHDLIATYCPNLCNSF
ncbi:3234_t:CDS:1 [Funneliformis mosseae]|uniref:3234_t:CDS:1 n=1 Tax=Funneliformis mosseae TaxID=27381 RepID=A0A9N9DKQ0_FUNMO|nr:3234_t:CDS:1 [Funneliformis mosseae]